MARKKTTASPRRRSHLDKGSIDLLSQRPYLSRPAPRHSLTWHEIGKDGDPWPEWLRTTYKSQCGVYAIKEHGKVVYVGSSRKRLYDTVTRHFQTWRRQKNFWKGMGGQHHDPGMTYKRASCQIAVYTVACGSELEEEARLIKKFKPRDNLQVNPDGEELENAPF